MKYDYLPLTNIKMIHVDNSYSFGIDSILLSNFSKMKKNSILIDIGAGSGVLSLLCNELYDLKKVHAVEIQKNKAKLLKNNIINNNIDNINIINEDINSVKDIFAENSIDYIIANPPYYKKDENIKNKSEEFNISRKEIFLDLDDIFNFAKAKLKDRAKLYMIHKPERLYDIFTKCKIMKPKRLKFIHSKDREKPKLVLIEFIKNAKDGLLIEDPIIIYENGDYTSQIKEIYGL
ncbi:MAG: methyltransferase [Tissierellia bacterium]|nr:methyltransferase [Tissierellia bacterium]